MGQLSANTIFLGNTRMIPCSVDVSMSTFDSMAIMNRALFINARRNLMQKQCVNSAVTIDNRPIMTTMVDLMTTMYDFCGRCLAQRGVLSVEYLYKKTGDNLGRELQEKHWQADLDD